MWLLPRYLVLLKHPFYVWHIILETMFDFARSMELLRKTGEPRIIDVSQGLGAFAFPGNPGCIPEGPFNRVDGTNREYVYDLKICTQSGTHVQGPHYFLADGKRIENFPLEQFQGTACLLDVRSDGVDTTRADLELALAEFEELPEIVVFRSGNMERIIEAQEIVPEERPGLSLDAAQYLVQETPFKMLAIDSIGFESRETSNYEVNKLLCEHGILLLEGLVNLYSINTKYFYLQAFPLRIEGVEGSPCRAVVWEYP